METNEQRPLLAEGETTIKKPKRTIIVEPLVLLYAFAYFAGVPITSQYIFVEIGKQHNYTQAGIGNSNVSACSRNESDPTYHLQQVVQKESATFMLYLTVVSSGIAVFVSLYLGGYADRRGRRRTLLIPILGQFLFYFATILVIYFKASISFLFIGVLLNGLCGSIGAFLTAVLSYIADCTTYETRSKRVTIVELLVGVGSSLSSFCMGPIISRTGFLWPTIVACSVNVIAFIYTLFFVPETVVSSPNSSVAVMDVLRSCVQVFTKERRSDRPKRLFIVLSALVCVFMIAKSSRSVQDYFLMNYPFCFTSLELGYLTGSFSVSVWVGAIIGIVLFLKILKMSDLDCSLIGLMSYIGRHAIFGVACSRVWIYAAIPAGLFEYMAMPLLLAKLSKTVSKTEQGSLFAVVGLVSQLVSFAVNFAWPAIYAHSLLFYKGLVFLIHAFIVFCGLMLVLMYKCLYGEEKTARVRLENVI